jgi:hypothetical protein
MATRHLPCECDYLLNFNLSHVYCIFIEKNHFLRRKFQISHMISKHGSNYVK